MHWEVISATRKGKQVKRDTHRDMGEGRMWAGSDLNRVVWRGFVEKVPFKAGKSEPCGYQGVRILSKDWSIKSKPGVSGQQPGPVQLDRTQGERGGQTREMAEGEMVKSCAGHQKDMAFTPRETQSLEGF